MGIEALILRIKQRDTLWAKWFYDLAIIGRGLNAPYVPYLHDSLYYERRVRLRTWRNLRMKLYYEPLMKSRCVSVGKNFRLVQALPLIGGNLKIFIGDNVTIDGTNTFGGNRAYESPKLVIGDNTFIGWHVTITVAEQVTIGNHCLFGINTMIGDNDSHPVDWRLRRKKTLVNKEDVRPVTIGNDVWVGQGCYILKGVTIGDGAVIGAGSVVVKDIPPYCIAVGNPAKVVRHLENDPE
jgi:acetyltransferase-like isoleucine patch superfamily enzyme